MKKLWGVNVDGTYLFSTGVANHLMARKAPGSIVMIGSMSGVIVNVPQRKSETALIIRPTVVLFTKQTSAGWKL
jgi:NAD(P)-dependent dehydrogenase (short-subunit alcohol dehydrogenase family)